MPRKAAAATTAASDGTEPRRSSRIKDLPRAEPVVKKPTKPRVKKADKSKEDGGETKEEKPKSARGRKRKEPEEPNGAAAAEEEGEGGEEPPTKKVSLLDPIRRSLLTMILR